MTAETPAPPPSEAQEPKAAIEWDPDDDTPCACADDVSECGPVSWAS